MHRAKVNLFVEKYREKSKRNHWSLATSVTPFLRYSWSSLLNPNFLKNHEIIDSLYTLFSSNPLGTEANGIPGTTDIFWFQMGMQINPCLFWPVYPIVMRVLQGKWGYPIMLTPCVKDAIMKQPDLVFS